MLSMLCLVYIEIPFKYRGLYNVRKKLAMGSSIRQIEV
jgi:hypothetical protein